MKRLVLVLILSSLPGLLFAETVMLFARVEPSVGGKGVNVERFVAVENGVEDQFYNAGHIIFDTGAPHSGGNGAVSHSNGWAEQVARSGGADFLLIVNLKFPEALKGADLPSTASYEFVDLKSGSMLAEGSVASQASEHELKTKKPYDLCFAFGRRIAEEAMTKWGPIP